MPSALAPLDSPKDAGDQDHTAKSKEHAEYLTFRQLFPKTKGEKRAQR